MPRPARLPLIVAATALLAAACGTPQRSPDDGQKLRLELAANLLDVADVGMTLFSSEVTRSYIDGDQSERYLVVQRTRNTAVNNLRALALGPDPTGALVDMYVWVRLAEQACANRNRAMVSLHERPYDCASTYGEIRRRIDQLMETGYDGKPVYQPGDREKLDSIVADFQRKHPDLLSAGLFRIDDLREYSGTRLEVIAQAPPAMLSPVEDARAEIERARLVAAQMVWLASRLPTAAGWEAETITDEVLFSKEVSTALQSARNIEKRLDETRATLATVTSAASDLSKSVDTLGNHVSEVAAAREVLQNGFWTIGAISLAALGALVLLGAIIARRLGRIVEVAFKSTKHH